METLLRFDNVSKQYANGVHALNGVSFDVEEGEFISVIGPSGSGKSTLLRSMTRKRNIACIVNLHQLDVALQYSTRIIGLSKGEIVFDGSPQWPCSLWPACCLSASTGARWHRASRTSAWCSGTWPISTSPIWI